MFARASLIALALTSPAWAGPDDYPAGLFEHSPVSDTPATVSRRGHNHPGQTKTPPSENASVACHHHLELSLAAAMLTRYPEWSLPDALSERWTGGGASLAGSSGPTDDPPAPTPQK
jgi:hypothetical protein